MTPDIGVNDREAAAHQLSALLTSALDGVVSIASDGAVVEWNPAAERIFGFPRDEAIGRKLADLIVPPSLRDQHRAGLERYLQTGKTAVIGKRVEVPAIRADGTEITIELAIAPVRLNGATYFTAYCRDITDRLLTRRRLELTQFAMDHAADAVFWMGADGRFTYVNKKACASLGYTREELLRLSTLDISPEFPRDAWEEHWRALREQRVVRLETLHRRKNGDVFPVEIHANYVEFGDEACNCAFVRDISDRVRNEGELREAIAAARAATKAKSEFVATMSHEIRTPLSAIIGMTELALEAPISAEHRHFITAIAESAGALHGLVDDLLDFSKIEAGRLDPSLGPFSLRRVLREAVRSIAQRAAREGLSVTIAVEDDAPDRLIGDETRIRQVLMNLLSNAVKFTERGFVEIRASGRIS